MATMAIQGSRSKGSCLHRLGGQLEIIWKVKGFESKLRPDKDWKEDEGEDAKHSA